MTQYLALEKSLKNTAKSLSGGTEHRLERLLVCLPHWLEKAQPPGLYV